MKKRAGLRDWMGIGVTVILFLVMFVVLMMGTSNLSGSANQEGLDATRQAIERAAVLCYASEGFYPPGLEYLKDHYGVQIDRARYSVRYEVFAPNVMPTIRVAEK